jgi:NAD(P)-dependent dehydrogenase (short-subunit alcohol dehydrogenase family)
MSAKTWFITGASRGFGREWAIAALERAATARDTASLDDLVERFGERLLPLQLDVTDREADFAAVRRAHDHFGRLDVVVNNAGYGHFGAGSPRTGAARRPGTPSRSGLRRVPRGGAEAARARTTSPSGSTTFTARSIARSTSARRGMSAGSELTSPVSVQKSRHSSHTGTSSRAACIWTSR